MLVVSKKPKEMEFGAMGPEAAAEESGCQGQSCPTLCGGKPHLQVLAGGTGIPSCLRSLRLPISDELAGVGLSMSPAA